MSGSLSRVGLRSVIRLRAQLLLQYQQQQQQQRTLLWRQDSVGFRRFGFAQQEHKSSEEVGSSYGAGKSRHEPAGGPSNSTNGNGAHKAEGEAGESGKAKDHSGSKSNTVGAGEFFADTFKKGFSFASSSLSAGVKRLKDAKIVDAVKGSYAFLKEELNTPASRRKPKESSKPFADVAKSSETAIVPLIKQRSAWQKRLDDILEKARGHPAYKQLRNVKQHPVVAKSQELAEDLRERWETSDSPVVHKIQDINDSLFGETATGVAMREIRRRDPLFSVPDFILEVQEDVRPILIAYLKGDFNTLRKKCSREVIDRCRAERTALESQGIYLDHKILHVSDVEVKDTKLMGNSPIIIVAFHTQQIYCARDKIGNITQGATDDIHTVYYAWAMQQLSSQELEEGEIHPRWQLREMQQLGIQAII